MLNQLIYTRCYPYRDLKNKGQVVKSDGFGVFSMSQDMITNPPIPNYDLLQTRLVAQNGAKENSIVGLFNSYEYTALNSEIYGLSYEVARPLCKVPRKNGIGHRPGNFIKQLFIGEFSDYPFKWFGAAEWSAYKKSENDYYLDEDQNAAPPLLPQIAGTPSGGYITPAIVRQFADDGRKEAIKAGVWFLIHELAKAENDRKVLLIKDTPDNVELWIAAIEYAFSAGMAKNITFSTNRTKLGTQVDNALFYYTDANGKLTTMLNRNLQQTRHPYNMIVGFHPKDAFCAGLRQTPASNFVMIDGDSKTFSFSTDESINKPYYSAVVKYDSDIQDFCNAVLPSLPVTGVTDKIPNLFDAYKYLLDSNHKAEKWSYGAALSALKEFIHFGIPKNDALNLYLLDEAFKAYPRFVEEDECNGFKLLKILSDLADASKREQEITGCIVDRVFSSMNDLEHSGDVLAKTWNAVKSSSVQKYLQTALNDVFNDSELGVYSNQFKNTKSETIGTVMEMYFTMLKNEHDGINSVLRSNEKFTFLCHAVSECIDDTVVLKKIMKQLSGSTGVVNSLAVAVFEYLDKYKPDKIMDWWDIVVDISGTNAQNLCKQLLVSKNANIDMIESFLANRIIRLQKCDRDSRDVFKEAVKKLGKTQKTGVRFFNAWLKLSEVSQANQIISAIRNSELDIAAEKELFAIIDNAVPCDSLFGANAIPIRDLKDWAKAIGTDSITVAKYDFKKTIENEFKPENALKLMLAFSDLKVPLPKRFTQSNYFKDIARKMADMCDKKLHLVFLGLFNIEDNHVLTQYSDAYVEEVLNSSRGKQLPVALIALCEAALYDKQITGKTSTYVRDMGKVLESSLALKIPNYYEKKLIEQIERSSVCEKEIKERLISWLKEAEAKAQPKSMFGKLLNSIFGKH